MGRRPRRVLVVDDDRQFRAAVSKILSHQGYEVLTAEDGLCAAKMLTEREFDLVLTDLQMPGQDGVSLLNQIRSRCPAPEVIVLTAFGDIDSYLKARRLGAADYLSKPVRRGELLAAAQRALKAREENACW
ncbi:MAG: response regulator [Deltaproteobacteria bacterium]|nr:response regulator [Deltaproteobacteria bacterium]MBI3079374.1 response regulator [Deltaproteobacteria bacterium]